MPDLHELLSRGARPAADAPPVGDIIRRGRRRAVRRRMAVATAVLAGVVVAMIGAREVVGSSPMPIVEQPPADVTTPTTSPRWSAPALPPPTPPDAAEPGEPLALQVGPALRVDDLTDLPDEGVAIGVGDGPEERVVFVELGGTVIGHLPSTFLAMPAAGGARGGPTTGPLLLAVESEDEGGYVEVGVREVRRLGRPDVQAGTTPERWPLAHGYVLERRRTGDPAGYHLVGPGGDTGFVLSTGRPWSVGVGREVVAQAGGVDEGQVTEAYDLVTGRPLELSGACVPHDRTADGMVVVCWDRAAPFADRDWARVELRRDDGPTERLLGPFVWPGQTMAMGHYRWAAVSPDGQWTAAHYSGECESPIAMVAPRGTTTPRPFIEADDLPVESHFHGWTANSRALVTVTEGVCGTGHDVPGLYLVDPAGGELTLLWEVDAGGWTAIQPWGPLEP